MAITKATRLCCSLFHGLQESNAQYSEQQTHIRVPSSEILKETINVLKRRFGVCLQMQMKIVLLTVES